MTTIQIIAEVNKIAELDATEAMYYLPQTDEVVIGRNGCQPSNSLCLRSGPDELHNLSMAEISEAIEEFLTR